MAAKDAADGGGRDSVSELEQLTLEATITPTRVLAAQAKDQFPYLLRDRRTTSLRAPTERSPMPAHQLSVPAQQGCG
jgi:hypothetical protein